LGAIGWVGVSAFLALGGTGGCGLLTLSTLSTLAGAAGSAASTGREVFSMGKLDTAEMQKANDVALAARKAALELGLDRKPIAAERGVGNLAIQEMEFVDKDRRYIKVRIDQRAARLVLLRIDVGFFGSEPIAHLFLNRLRAHLPDSGQANARSSG
jgi:hypothetical protein